MIKLNLGYEISIVEEMRRKPISQHPGLGTGLLDPTDWCHPQCALGTVSLQCFYGIFRGFSEMRSSNIVPNLN